MFNEATEALGDLWPQRTGGNTRSFGHSRARGDETTSLARALKQGGVWVVDGKHTPIIFYEGGRVFSPWGTGSWSHKEGTRVAFTLCGDAELEFNGVTPTEFTYKRKPRTMFVSSGSGRGALVDAYRDAPAPPEGWDASHPAVLRVMGKGPWAWAGIAPLAFFQWWPHAHALGCGPTIPSRARLTRSLSLSSAPCTASSSANVTHSIRRANAMARR